MNLYSKKLPPPPIEWLIEIDCNSFCPISDTPVGTSSAASGASTSGGDDIFSSFLSAPPAAPSAVNASPSPDRRDNDNKGRSAEEESFFNQPAPSNQEKRQLTKDSILALYSAMPSQAQAGNSAPMFGIPGTVMQPSAYTRYRMS